MRYLALIPFLAACAGGSSETVGYGAPAWNRSYCTTIVWAQQGAEDGKRYNNGEKRLEALNRICGKHLDIPRDEYLNAFNAAKAS